MKISELSINERVIQLIQESGITELFPPQEDAINAGLLNRENVVLAVPTSSGKTLIAELAMVHDILNGYGKAIYMAPLRAIASEKYKEFKKYEKIGLRVGLTMGDYDSDDPELETYDIVVATIEKLDALMRHRAKWLQDIGTIVADEVHLLTDPLRGPTLEMAITKIRKMLTNVRLVFLSATIQNSRELAKWIDAKLVQSNWRPVPLKEGVYLDSYVYYDDGSTKRIKVKKNAVISLVEDTVANKGQALVFVNSRSSAVKLAEVLSKTLKKYITDEERTKIEETFSNADLVETDLLEKLKRSSINGVAFHHAGLSNTERQIVEDLFKANILKVITATPTLAAGVNLPARRVIIRDYKRYDMNYGLIPIPVLEIKQMSGRAGRPKYDKEGESVLIAKNDREFEFLFDNYISGESERITSKLATESILRTHLLGVVAGEFANNHEELKDLLTQTFYAFQNDIYVLDEAIDNALEFLNYHELIEINDEKFFATQFGKRVAQLYIDPMTAIIIKNSIKYLESRNISEFAILALISHTPDVNTIYVRVNERGRLHKLAYDHKNEFIYDVNVDYSLDDDWFLSEIKTTELLLDWINEVSEKQITNKYSIGLGDIANIVSKAEWILYASGEIYKILGHAEIKKITDILRIRVKHGIKEELIDFVSLKGIGRARARAIYRAGYKTISQLKNATLNDIVSIPMIGKNLAISIKKQLGTYDPNEKISETKQKNKPIRSGQTKITDF